MKRLDPISPRGVPPAGWNPFGRRLDEVLAERWLAILGSFDYGVATAYLLFAYGPPDKDGEVDVWCLDTGNGYLIRVAPKFTWAIDDCGVEPMAAGLMAAHRTIEVAPLSGDAPRLSMELIDRWMMEFLRPVYIRDVGANAKGPLHRQASAPDVGRHHESVIRGVHGYRESDYLT